MANRVFYPTFERHDHAAGLKAHATHYCAGCGHGLVHRYLAESIDELGIQDRTVAISPVGCAVFMYYYLDVGNTQAAHGRAPAVALGHKLANPDSVVISYQGDGDLASIGLAEIFSAAQLGVPLSVIFVNNAIYGMTGGQMAPTTLPGQKTTTSPQGRDRSMGQPLRVAEQMALLDGTSYVERVALYDAKQRVRAKKAIKKALQLQIEGRGVGFVEILAECPTHLKGSAADAEKWVREVMVPFFPLGVKKDTTPESHPAWTPHGDPSFDAETVAALFGADEPEPVRTGEGLAAALGDQVALKLAGAGGDGAQTAALLLARAAIHEGLDATHIPSYGPESRGGTSYADVRIARHAVASPAVPEPEVLVAFNAPSLERFGPLVRAGGTILYDASVVPVAPELPEGVRAVGIPCSEIAASVGRVMVKNVVALGALLGITGLLPEATVLGAVRDALREKPALLEMNERAFAAGLRAGRAARGAA
jgi:2-oxoisovalerate ferredoxin oxidoreductase beta subunit